MKALIIDDEPPVITVVRMLVNWDQFAIDTVLTCSSSEKALEIIEAEEPEIILSDVNLPGLSGLDLVQRLRDQGSDAQVVLISAYDKFSYAQRAMQLDCVEYLLKPIDRETVNRAVEKAVSKYREATDLKEDTDRLRAQNLFSAYISSGKDTSGKALAIFDELCGQIPWLCESASCRIGVVSLQHLAKEGFTQYAVQSSLQDYLYRNRLGVATVWGDNADIVMLFTRETGEEEVCSLCRGMLRELREATGLVLHAGISGEVPCPSGIHDAYRVALDLALSANLYSGEVSADTRLVAVPPLSSLLWIDKVLFAAVSERSEERVRATVGELAEHLDRSGAVSVRQLENFRSMYNSQRSKWILARQKEQGIEIQLPKDFRTSFCLADGRFSAEHFQNVLCGDLMALQEQYMPEDAISTAELCRRAQNYLEENYSEEISLEDLARKLGISQSYLSRSFKKELGLSLIDYLTQYRVGKACEMLAGGMRTADIAAAVGWPDPKYFSRVFKKVKGVSPSEYRDGLKGGDAP